MGELSADRTAAVTELFQMHYPQLVRLARFLVDDAETAEDVVMDAFVALHRRWSAIRDPHDAYRYVRSCVVNGARSQLRRRRVVRLHQAVTAVPPSGPAGRSRRGHGRLDPRNGDGAAAHVAEPATTGAGSSLLRQPVGVRDRRCSRDAVPDRSRPMPRRGMSAMAQALGEVR